MPLDDHHFLQTASSIKANTLSTSGPNASNRFCSTSIDDIGEPQSVALFCDQRISLSDQYVGHINAVATYTSGFKLTDLFGSYQVEKPELLKVEALGGALLPLAEGSTKVSFTSSTGLAAETTITVTR